MLRHIDLEVPERCFLGLIGPNGSGKTTLLRAILGLQRPTSGRIEYPSGKAPRCGYIQQRQSIDELFPFTVGEIVLMGRVALVGAGRRFREADRAAASAALQTTGISALADRLYRELSGGQKQRCLLARALAMEPDLLVLDEPTSDLDIAGEEATLQLIARIQRERGLTAIMVSHRLDVVINFVDRLALVHDGTLATGLLEEMLTADLLRRFLGIPVVIGRVGRKRVLVAGDSDLPAGED